MANGLRKGMALFLVLVLVLVLTTFGLVLGGLSSASYREVDILGDHLRAVSVGEIAFSQIVARLIRTPWSERWFKAQPDAQFDMSADQGAFDYIIRDTPSGGARSVTCFGSCNQADLLVLATHGRSTVGMFWRLTVVDDSLEAYRRAIPSVFTFTPESTRPTPGDLDGLTQQIDDLINTRIRNTQNLPQVWPPGRGQLPADQIASGLGLQPAGPIYDPQGPPRDDPAPKALPSDLVGPPTPGDATLKVYYSTDPPGPEITVRPVATSDGRLRYTLIDKMVCYDPERRPVAELTLPDAAAIEAASVQVSGYNDDVNGHAQSPYLAVDGEGGYVGTTWISQSREDLSGDMRIQYRETKTREYDLSSLVVAPVDPAGPETGTVTLSLLDSLRKPGSCRFDCWMSTPAKCGKNSWVSLDLIIKRSAAGTQ